MNANDSMTVTTAAAAGAGTAAAAVTYHGKTLHIAPMMHYSNREFRELFRILSKRCTATLQAQDLKPVMKVVSATWVHWRTAKQRTERMLEQQT